MRAYTLDFHQPGAIVSGPAETAEHRSGGPVGHLHFKKTRNWDWVSPLLGRLTRRIDRFGNIKQDSYSK